MRTIVDAVATAATGSGTLTVLGGDGAVAERATWHAVHDSARRIATVLRGAGVGPGARVGLLADTGLGTVCALQAAWLAGASITVLPPPSRRADTLRAIADDAALDVVVADRPVEGLDTTPLDRLLAAAREAAPADPYRPEKCDLAVLQYTSGSTRAPRGVPVTHAHLAANLAAIAAATRHEASHPSRMFSWLPLYHDLGLIGFLALPMSCGCPLVLQSPAAFARRPVGWFEAVSRFGITTTGAPNFAFALLGAALEAGLRVRLDSLRLLLSGGEPIDAAMMARFLAAAAPAGLDPEAFVPAYGLAESTLAVSFGRGLRTDADPRGRPPVLLGHCVPGTEVRIVDGQFEIRGPSVVGHYLGEPAPPAGSWWRTGDLGHLSDAGELVVSGRARDVLFAAGRNVFPQDVEAAAGEVRGVGSGRSAAFGLPGRDGDRLVVAVETRRTDAEGLRRDVVAAVLAEVGLAPHAVVPLPAGRLPRTSSGKLRRAETRRRYENGELVRPERTVR